MKATLTNLAKGLDGGYQLTVETRDPAIVDAWNELKGRPVRLDMKQWHNRRSRDANAYAWTLIDKLAEKMNVSKTEIYREAIRNIGSVSDTCCVTDRAVESLINGWQHNGLGWFAETMPSKIKGCTNVILYRGSSTYDSRQMSALIDIIVQDCKAVGIETATPQEIAAMNAAWG